MGRAVPVEPEGGFEIEGAIPDVPLTVAAVAARLGVAPSTLRTWDRRYGLGPSGRTAGSHRRYTPEDVARLETMRRLTLAGAAPSDAARAAARETPGATIPLVSVSEPTGQTRVDDLTLAAAAVDGAEARVRGIVAAAVRARGVLGAWLEIGHPAFGYLADREPGDRAGRDPETLLAAAFVVAARAAADAAESRWDSSASVPRAALLADPASCTERVGAHVLAAALVERGVAARVFGHVKGLASVTRSLEGAPASALAVVGNPPGGEDLARSAGESGRQPVFLVGPDAPEVWLPGVTRVRTLQGAVHEMVDLLADGEG